MKRLVVIFSLVLLCMSAGNVEAARYVRCYHHYCYAPHYYFPRPMVVCGFYPRAYIPGYWRWSVRYHRYFRVPGYWR